MQQAWETLPKQFTDKVLRLFGEQQGTSILESFCFTSLPTIRINPLKTSLEAYLEIMNSNGIIVEPLQWYKLAFRITNKTIRELTELDSYKKGFFYIQSLSSMIPALVLDPQPQEKILDIAAAPGSKTTQIAAMMNNTGEIIANDISRIRIYKLEDNLKQQGVTNTKTNIGIGEKIWQKYPEYFDKTLVDVLCSMEGRFNCNDPASYDHWSPRKVKQLAKQQQWLLRSAISATKPGGTIVYSTCTLSPEENEAVIDWILAKEKGALVTEDILIPSLQHDAPITSWNNRIFHSDIQKTLRINPSRTMEGFYIAKLRKLRSTVKQSVY